jgi:riboflavin transporter 2
MVHELPEGWRLPSVLTVTIELAQISPVIFVVGRYFAPKQFTYVRANYLILGVGALSLFLLSFFWDYTAFIFNENRSVGLVLLCFLLGILGLTLNSNYQQITNQ